MSLQIPVVRLPHAEDLPLPQYQSAEAAGLDLLAAVPAAEPIVIAPSSYAQIPTGIMIALPLGFEGQVRPRSGLAARHGLTVLNAPGTIDSDYRGEVSVLLVNHGDQAVSITRGMRIAQLVIAPVMRVQLTQMPKLPETARAAGGFGSTGTKSETPAKR